MRSIYHDVRRRGGVAATFELLGDGHTSHSLTAAVRSGLILRARQGHYALAELPAHELAAVRVGGRLTGLTGLRRHNVWTPSRVDLWVEVTSHARGLRTPSDPTRKLRPVHRPGVSIVWSAQPDTGTRSLVGVRGCLRQVARSQPGRVAFAAAESALYLGKVSVGEWRRIVAELPRDRSQALAAAGRLSQSGGESLATYELFMARIRFLQQVPIAGVGRVDILLGNRLVVEVDGAEFHTSREAFEEDRRRDAILSALGYRVLRFSYTQVAERWPEVFAAIVAALLRGDHLA